MKYIIPFITCLLLVCSKVNAQDSEEQATTAEPTPEEQAAALGITEVMERVQRQVASGDYVSARPQLLTLKDRFIEEAGDPDYDLLIQNVVFYLALSYLQEYSMGNTEGTLEEAVVWLNKYEELYPEGEAMPRVLMIRGDAMRGLGNLEKAAEDYAKLLNPPYLNELSVDQKLSGLEKISKVYYFLKNWEEGPKYFRGLMNMTRDVETKSFATTALMEALLKTGDFSKAIDLLEFLVSDSPSRYYLQFNLSMLNAGDELREAGQNSQAALLYSLVKTIPEVKAYFEKRIIEQQQLLARLEIAYSDAQDPRVREQQIAVQTTQAHLDAVNQLIENGESYTAELKVRIARNYLEAQRKFEAFWAYLRVVEEHPDHELAGTFIYTAFRLAMEVNIDSEIERLGETYLDDPRVEEYRNDIAVKLAEYYHKRAMWAKLARIADQYISQAPDGVHAGSMIYFVGSSYIQRTQFDQLVFKFTSYIDQYGETALADSVYYWRGMGSMLAGDYQSAYDDFEQVLAFYERKQEETQTRVNTPYLQDTMYRIGICLFGLERYEEARVKLEAFIKNNEDSPLVGEAMFYLGDIYAIQNKPEKALEFYLNVEKLTTNIDFIRDAYMQGGKLLETTQQWEQMEELYIKFIEKFGQQTDTSMALSQIGKARFHQDKIEPMIEAYTKAIAEYGNDKNSYGVDQALIEYPEFYYQKQDRLQKNVDFFTKLAQEPTYREELMQDRSQLYRTVMMDADIDKEIAKKLQNDKEFSLGLINDPAPIQEWIAKYKTQLEAFPSMTPEQFFMPIYEQTVGDDDFKTLRYRMIMAMEKLGNNLEPDLTLTSNDLEAASPALLVWMGKRLEQDNPILAREAYLTVVDDFEGTQPRAEAMLRLAQLLEAQGERDLALAYYEQAEQNYAGTELGSEIVLSHAELLKLAGDFDKALDKFRFVMQNPEWSGEPMARALFGIGEIYFEQSKYKEANLFYERVYLGHQGHLKWVAQSYLKAIEALTLMQETDRAREVVGTAMQVPGIEGTSVYQELQNQQTRLN